ncbi:hypothetical protein JZO77_03385 [Enterococcus hulanensis]|uniref:hypothetical protein n=1 Tax=Enterococcus hulanensis TaxID=2559929 RepID=UPI001A8F8241|nr:hypothetical protein [Enterococcus hulanensis]MBO0455781.1 hypothetical protein [Enterococcus hulanensis]
MGMYTSLRGVVEVKPECYELTQQIVESRWSVQTNPEIEEYPFVSEYLKTERSDWIPNGKELQYPFEDEQDFFKSKFEEGKFYFSSDLTNYCDSSTGLKPIESFMKNILENISERILVLETCYEVYPTVYQYGFSKKVVNQIEILNYTNKEKLSNPFFYQEDDDPDNDIFKEYKEKNGLRIFR